MVVNYKTKFEEYLKKHNMHPMDFSFGAEISFSTVHRLRQGYSVGHEIARKIEIFTKGELKYKEMRGHGRTGK